MIIYTAKFSKKKAVAILIAMAIIIAAIILMTPERGEGQTAFSSVAGIKDTEDMVAYIESLGYKAESEPQQEKEVTIPESFDLVYEQYNELQKKCGFDLSQYQGKKVTLYTYGLTEYPGAENVLCDLLVYRDRIIGGNIYTVALDGFMCGLTPQEG
ncbi:MAG: DUF4830 domain-containing protein [Clostridiaceae bacterium]|nr:DUF4830 domain-containing protein [Clostridiaceae bacterium]